MPTWRPPPAPTTGRKPQTGARGHRVSALGPRLNYLAWLHAQGTALAELAVQEAELRSKELSSVQAGRGRRFASPMPSPLTGAISLEPGTDPLLRLDRDALRRLDPSRSVVFDPTRPAVAVTLQFLGARRDLLQLGVIPALQAGDLFIGWVNLDRVRELEWHPAVVHVETQRTWAPTSGSDLDEQGIPNGAALVDANVTGQGVRLAVVDLGFDFLHPAFLRQTESGEQVRTLWLHDMALPRLASAPAGTLGLRLTGAELQEALDWYRSPESTLPGPNAVETHLKRLATIVATPAYRRLVQQHGTAVTGIAAGNGRGDPNEATPPLPGVAPDADLILIAIGSHDETRFANCSEVLAAFQTAFEDATAPCVALMANSDNLGPHDGSLHGERFLDELLLQPGRAVVLSAGNLNHPASADSGRAAMHAIAHPGQESGPPLPLVLRYESGAVWPDSAEIWFHPPAGEAPAATISIRVLGNTIDPAVTIAESAEPTTILSPCRNPHDLTTVTAQLQRDDEADACCLRLVFRPARFKEIAQSEWTIHVVAQGSVHAWLDRNNDGIGRWVGPTAQAGADRTTLGSPACATRPLAIGSVANSCGIPSDFSGRGPLRAATNGTRKPDLVAVGENVSAPRALPADRRGHLSPPGSAYMPCVPPGTSYAAPQVAGACALLFQRFGAIATWADIRQAILQATVRRSGMPTPEVGSWDYACGYGLLDLNLLLAPPAPVTADAWLPKAPGDTGTEPFVARTFWDSPAMVLEDAAGRVLDPAAAATGQATPARLRVRVANRGEQPARDVVVTTWWAPLGAAHPLPRPEGSAWQTEGFGVKGGAGNLQHVAEIAPGGLVERVFDWAPPLDANNTVIPHLLLATVEAEDDPLDPADTLCAQNNAAMLSIAATRDGLSVPFQILGSEDTDALIFWCDDPNARLRIENLPVTALPWRDAEMFQVSGHKSRQLYGAEDALDDIAVRLNATLDGPEQVAEVTDIQGATRLVLEDGRVVIDAGAQLVLPRLRIVQGTPLVVQVAPLGQTLGAIHMLHLSGGRRVGGGTAQIST